ncbi:Undecaprenyl phosphate-alpha-4-amino-4-deoxy-L-arabinose arabinosyl transferase [Fructobacillus sp. EFB-N1]|uniref:glycosyltransferase family 39 protein n=1 Tax=Fructobacillus sp. EFB-N1 TaxID=1658766 RepID=UPI00064D81A8|nr:glycosyltransferase family 39 protein [Fructobacillus sp. EFB-N1]KMK53682.1 Undecaprenyl phosphate-alpha-4-amino-4-deoxy-L-arabinose arabinosyl transferase [Fructobacillus sp. EFB-N1]
MRSKRIYKLDWYLVGILILSAILYGWGIWDAGSANSFYTAAITSMTKSWSNFWYGAFDPAGFITVDKPPVALWFMAISAKIFGVHGWSVVLPSVLAGIASVYLMYRLLAPKFGVWAGRTAALFMTLTPTVVANSRTNNMDAILVLFLLLAVFTLQKAVNKRNVWLVMLSFALIGVSFNIKMLQAFMILPAMFAYYIVAIKIPWKKKIGWLGLALVSLSVFTLAYPMAVDSASKSSRPYIGSSQTNSLMELAFGYNGTQRLLGQSTGTGGTFSGMGTKKTSKTSKSSKSATGTNQMGQAPTTGTGTTGQTANGQNQTGTQTGQTTNGTAPTGQAPTGMNGKKPTGKMGKMTGQPGGKTGKHGGMGGAGSAFAIGSIGPFRLFQSDLGSQIGWYLPLAFLGLIAGWLGFRKRGSKWYHVSSEQEEVLLWAGWLVPVYGFFSVASFFHPYYTIMLAPAIAALTAIGVAAVAKMMKVDANSEDETVDKTQPFVARIMLSVAVIATLLLQAYYVSSYYPVITGILIVLAVALGVWWLFPQKTAIKAKIIATAVSVLTMGAFWAATPTITHTSAAIPAAGPSLFSRGGTDMGGTVNKKLLAYTEKHQGSAKYLFATTDSNSASGYIIKSGKAVMALGGYNGTDPTMTFKQFKQLVKDGKLKYFVLGSRSKSSDGQIKKILAWVKEKGTVVTYDSSSKSTTTAASQTTATTAGGPTAGGMTAGGPTGMGGSSSSTLYDLSSIY